MKYITILLLLSYSSLSFSEGIVGFDFGGKLLNSNEYKKVDIDALLPNEYIVDDVKFFDFAQVGTNEDDIIKTLAFVKDYKYTIQTLSVDKVVIKDDYKKVLSSLEERYGKFDNENADKILGVIGKTNSFYISKVSQKSINKAPDSKDVGTIILVLEGDEEESFIIGGKKTLTLMLVYLDNTVTAMLNKKSEDEVSGF